MAELDLLGGFYQTVKQHGKFHDSKLPIRIHSMEGTANDNFGKEDNFSTLYPFYTIDGVANPNALRADHITVGIVVSTIYPATKFISRLNRFPFLMFNAPVLEERSRQSSTGNLFYAMIKARTETLHERTINILWRGDVEGNLSDNFALSTYQMEVCMIPEHTDCNRNLEKMNEKFLIGAIPEDITSKIAEFNQNFRR